MFGRDGQYLADELLVKVREAGRKASPIQLPHLHIIHATGRLSSPQATKTDAPTRQFPAAQKIPKYRTIFCTQDCCCDQDTVFCLAPGFHF
eukprot:scaffold83525_cov29-Prasinocladus_malaysianus.AAC.1